MILKMFRPAERHSTLRVDTNGLRWVNSGRMTINISLAFSVAIQSLIPRKKNARDKNPP